jgi:hypothetical protein
MSRIVATSSGPRKQLSKLSTGFIVLGHVSRDLSIISDLISESQSFVNEFGTEKTVEGFILAEIPARHFVRKINDEIRVQGSI